MASAGEDRRQTRFTSGWPPTQRLSRGRTCRRFRSAFIDRPRAFTLWLLAGSLRSLPPPWQRFWPARLVAAPPRQGGTFETFHAPACPSRVPRHQGFPCVHGLNERLLPCRSGLWMLLQPSIQELLIWVDDIPYDDCSLNCCSPIISRSAYPSVWCIPLRGFCRSGVRLMIRYWKLGEFQSLHSSLAPTAVRYPGKTMKKAGRPRALSRSISCDPRGAEPAAAGWFL